MPSTMEAVVPMVVVSSAGDDLRGSSHVLGGGGSGEAGVIAVPESYVVSYHDAAYGVDEIFGLEIGELLLLVA